MNRRPDIQLFIKTPGNFVTHSQAQQLLALGDLMGWQPLLIGKAPMIDAPIRLQDWLLVPAHEDQTPVPVRSLRRIRTIYAQGLRPKGFVVVHEAPRQLAAPKVVKPDREIKLDGIGKVAGVIAKVLGILMLGSMLLPLGLITGAVLLDPILVAVSEDGYWIEIDRWQA